MASEKIFITGGSGYIGSVIITLALASGYTITALSRSPTSDEKLRALGATPVRGHLKTYDVLTQESTKADIVIHLADLLSDDFTLDYSEVTKADGAAVDAITEGLKATNKRLIVTSGSLVSAADPNGEETNESSPYWENPINNRIKSEQYALAQSEKGIRVTAIRLAPYVYGRGGSGVKLFMGLAAKSGEVVYIGDGSTRITTVHVDDAARLYLLAAKAESGGIYNATYETGVTQLQLSEAMGKILHLPTKSKSFDEVAAKSMVFLARFLSTENRASNAKARRELGWNPVEIGILEEIEKGSYTHVAETLGAKAA